MYHGSKHMQTHVQSPHTEFFCCCDSEHKHFVCCLAAATAAASTTYMHKAHPVTSRQQIESCTPTKIECSNNAAENVSGIGRPPEKPSIAHRASINMRFKAMLGLKKQSRMTTCIERELVTGYEIPCIVAHSCIKVASIGEHRPDPRCTT
jgi:hypothetical protein